MNNQIDLSSVYGLGTALDSSDTSPSNYTEVAYIPSLEQIASYNLASLGYPIATSRGTLPPSARLPQPPEDIENGEPIQTPAETMMYPTGMPANVAFDQALENSRMSIQPQTTMQTSTTQSTDTRPSVSRSASTAVPSQTNTATDDIAITDFSNPFPVTAESIQYLNGFIRTQIGRRMEVTFLVGSNTLTTKQGFLLGVGANYILMNELDTNDLTACDFYNIKFIRFFY